MDGYQWRITSVLLVGLGLGLSLVGMKPGSDALFVGRSTSMIEAIRSAGKGSVVRFESPFFSHKGIADALCSAAQRGADTVVRLTSRSKVDREEMRKQGVKVKELPELHAKRCLIGTPDTKKRKRGDGDNEGPGEAVVFDGSDNCSVLSQYHKEVMVVTRGDDSYFSQHLKLFNTPTKKLERSVIKETPEKRSVVGSADYQMNESKGERIRKLADSMDPNDSLDITSMTFDSDEIVSAIEAVYKARPLQGPKMRLILDRSALNHRELLDRIKNAGKLGVSIYIYNKNAQKKIWGRFPQIQHTKTMTRFCGGSYLSIISTGNLTKNSDQNDFNTDGYHPEDKKLFESIRAYNDALVQECTEYTV